jgi:2-C-methyl-D-erythritol 4-phosphate cytidylyltransferase
VIVAAGGSSRMGGIDKAWATLGERPVLQWSLDRLSSWCEEVVVVVQPEHVLRASSSLAANGSPVRVVAGGAVRQESVARGMEALPRTEVIAVHDAARPLATAQMLRNGLTLLDSADGAVPVQPVKDTIKRVDGEGTISGTVDRSLLRAAQTPQIFRSEALRRAHSAALSHGREETDDAALLEAVGMLVVTFPGHWTNFKITTPDDLNLARLLIDNPDRVSL